ncbi:hypothetical protein ZIOFF_026195 [Zingiber officinale]|uniref:Uncharacterized protein n=1 Tax=Zingiber officinale TaxID=94328 RepID=A0A8J5HGD3_ZINOF|nr:hypothetical protein ZIOFF_026195 [Zingiber officinale]
MAEAKPEESSSALQDLLSRSFLFVSAFFSHPLFSILAAASLLVALYIPRSLLTLLLSPVFISTFLLLVALLCFGSSPPAAAAAAEETELPESCPETDMECASYHRKVTFFDDLGRRSGPLEVIYEEEEGECGGVGFQEYQRWPQNSDLGSWGLGSLRFAGLDSDSDSDAGSPIEAAEGSSSPEELRLRWEEEDQEEDGDDMIEIDLKGEAEENLIEIDIFGCR